MRTSLFANLNPFRTRQQRLARRKVRLSAVTVEDLEVRALLSTFTVNGHIDWTDGAGGKHAAPLITVEVHRLGAGSTDAGTLATTTTNLVGDYTVSVNTGDNTAPTDVFVRILSRSVIADVKPSADGSSTYAVDSTDFLGIANGGTQKIDVTAGNSNDAGKSFSVNNALLMISQYTSNLIGWAPSQIDTRFDASVTGSFFSSDPKQIFIRGTAWNQWDPIQHEFGHYVMNQFDFQANPGGKHSSKTNLSQQRGSEAIGLPLAWGEGWPTFFAISGQVSMGAAAYNIPEVGDPFYQSTNGGLILNDLEGDTGKGEDNELSVMTTMWDLWDQVSDGLDDVSFDALTLFDYFSFAGATTVGEAWDAIADDMDNAGKAQVGAVFAQNNIAPNLQSPADGENVTGATPPEFTWLKNGGGTPNPLNDFRITFYTPDMQTQIFQKDLADTDHYTPTATDWATILSEGPIVKWVIEGRNTTGVATPGGSLGYYWSQARTIGSSSTVFVIDDTGSMGEEIESVKAALQDYINLVDDTLPEGVDPPSITVITFKDDVTVRITSTDLDQIRNVISGLFASGGGDCPEASAEAMVVAADIVGAGGTILLATDASTHPGTDVSGVIAKLRAKGVTFNVILSGDCGPIESESSAGAPGPGTPSTGTDQDDDDCDCGCDDGDCNCNGDEAAPAPANIAPPSVPTHAPSYAASGSAQEPSGDVDGTDDDDGPQEFVNDEGQPPIDDFGNSADEAATLTLNAASLLGTVGREGDADDFFKIALEADTTYTLTINPLNFTSVSVRFLDTDGATTLDSTAAFGERVDFTVTPDADGTYFFDVESYFGEVAPYLIRITKQVATIGTSAVETFSTVAAETGGTFLVRDDVNFGDDDAYVAALFNVMSSTLGPAVLSANPDSVPSGQTVAVSLTGRGTNWHQGDTSVSFSNAGLVVQSVQVTSPTTLTAIVQVGAGVAPDLYDATVETELGGDTETALGVNVLLVTGPVTSPTLLGVNPGVFVQGTTGNAIVRGANVNWDDDVTVDLGPGITVTDVHADSATQLTVSYTVAAGASIGFRTASVDQSGGDFVSLSRALFVSTAGVEIPEIVGISDDDGTPGTSLDITLTGLNTHFVDGVTTASFGNGIQVTSVDVTSSTQVLVHINISADADPGFRTIVVSTNDENAVLLSGFFVTAGEVGGNVTATATKSTLTITGDDLANHVTVTINDDKTITIQGLNGTTINGQASVTLTSKALAVVNMGSGDDELVITSDRPNGIKKSASIDMGSGDDLLQLEHLRIKGRARLKLGAGHDELDLLDVLFSKQTTNDVNPAEDTVHQLSSSAIKSKGKAHGAKGSVKGPKKAK